MEHVRLRNLRCLADTGEIEIKPVSLLVGANSSGKSTFLRVFPLLRQSIETRTQSGLLLNEGDVNFGFFNEVVFKDANPQELKLEFGVLLEPDSYYQGGLSNRFLLGPIPTKCELIYEKRSKDFRYPYLRSLKLTLGPTGDAHQVELCCDEEGKITKYQVNEFRADGYVSQFRLRVSRGVVPSLVRSLDDKDPGDQGLIPSESEIGPFDKKLLDETDHLFHGRTTPETRLAIFREIRIGSHQAMLESMKQLGGVASWRDRIVNWTTQDGQFRKVCDLVMARAAGDILTSVNRVLSQLAASVHYFQPIRASVERDYLSRDVQVGSIDPRGLNVAMVLASLSPKAMGEFRNWLRKHFGFEVFPHSVGDGARIALRMREERTGSEFNMADMGFGFSQMLPFLLQIWNIVEREPERPRRYPQYLNQNTGRSFIVAVEQPELHLHPALQARLADLIVTTARLSRDKKVAVRFVLETHSPVIIERVGALVEAGHLGSDDVQVLLFEKSKDGKPSHATTVRKSNFDSKGILIDWPFGFLSAPPTPVPPIPTTPSN